MNTRDFSRRFAVVFALTVFVAINGKSVGQTNSAAMDSTAAPQVIRKAELGTTENVHRAGDLYFAGQFSQSDIDRIKAEQFDRVITLRTDGEIDWDEQAAIEAAGIDFIQVPFGSPESLDDQVFDEIRKLLSDRDSKTLLHCGSANRVGGVWLPFRVLDEKMPLSFAIQEAEEIGLKTAFIKDKALDYINRQQLLTSSQIDRTEESVKPGINNSFLDSDLNVDEMVKRFEVESREIYAARNRIIAAARLLPGARVADVGSGTGLFTVRFAEMVGKDGWIYAVDISPRLVEHVAREAERRKLNNVSAVLCHEDHICLPPESVDVVFICDTYHHFEYPQSTMSSIFQALRPGGQLLVIDFERIAGKSREWIMGHVRAGKEVFRAEIQDAGFRFTEEIQIDDLKENYFLRFTKPR